jgi:hypothetical protein
MSAGAAPFDSKGAVFDSSAGGRPSGFQGGQVPVHPLAGAAPFDFKGAVFDFSGLYFAVNYRSGIMRPARQQSGGSRKQGKGTLVGQAEGPPADRIGPCRKCPATFPAKGMSFRGRYLGVSIADCAERKWFCTVCATSYWNPRAGLSTPLFHRFCSWKEVSNLTSSTQQRARPEFCRLVQFPGHVLGRDRR